jgi:hypothetical protein
MIHSETDLRKYGLLNIISIIWMNGTPKKLFFSELIMTKDFVRV